MKIEILQHEASDLMVAISDELPGLMVPGRSVEEVLSKLEDSIRALLEAEGKHVQSFEPIREDPRRPAGFIPPAFIADAMLSNTAPI